MNIQTLTVRSFGKLKDTTVRLSPGINIISGSNESGKSTLTRFIRFMLYGLDRARASLSDNDKKRYTPFDGDSLRGSMVFESEDKTYTLRREAGVKTAFSAVDENGDTVFSDGVPGSGIFGVSAEVFDRTAFVSAGDVAFTDASSLCAAIQNTVFSADSGVDTAKAIDKLDTMRKTILGKSGKSGRLFEARTAYAALCDRRSDAITANEVIRALEASLEAASAKLDENRSTLRKIQDELDAHDAKKAAMMLDGISGAKEALERAEKERDDKRIAMTLDGFFPNKAFLAELSDFVSEIGRCDERLAAARREFEGAEEALRDVFRDTRQIKFNAALADSGKTSEDLSFELNSLCDELNRVSHRMILFFCLILTFPLGIAALLKRKKLTASLTELCASFECGDETELAALLRGSRRTDEMTNAAKRRCAAAKEALDDAVGKRYEAAKNVAYSLERSGRHVGDTSDIVRAANEQIRFLEREITAFDALVNSVGIAQAKYEALYSAAGDMDVLRDKALKYDANAVLRDEAVVRREADFYGKATESLLTRVRDLEKRLAAARSGADDLDTLTERITALENEIRTLEANDAALTLAHDTLQGAADEIRREVSPILTERASAYFREVTDGRYDGLFIRDDLTLSFSAAGDDIRRDTAYLSTGTLDAAYLCTRLSLIETIYGTKPVIIFDDAFSHLDDARLEGVCRLLSLLAKEYQILILTCHSREEAIFGDKADIIRF